MNRSFVTRAASFFALAASLSAHTPIQAQAPETEARVDYLTFAQGAIPVAIGGDPAARATFEHAVAAIDGADGGFTFTTLIDPGLPVEFIYELPALTRFDRFAIPNVLETPSPSQTFARDIEILGSASSAEEGFVLLASGMLETHTGRGQATELTLADTAPVRWIKIVLSNGIDVQRERMFLEFSEIIGNGTQEESSLSTAFDGGWQGRGVAMLLRQDGAVVSGCYDTTGDLSGTVSGRVMNATGIDRDDGTGSAFVVTVGDDGVMRGVRSTNGAPFRLFEAEAATDIARLRCAEPTPPALGCGSIVHGIRFEFDSAAVTPESDAVIESLAQGLAAESAGAILIEGHTSSEGSDTYNQALSERRARSVVEALAARGIAAERLSASGIGEGRPLASNDDESGRALNRRVEIHCETP